MLPTAIVAIPASCRTRSANGVWYIRPNTGRSAFTTWPLDTSIMSAPAALNAFAISTASSAVLPPRAQSCAEMRTDIGLSAGHASRIA